MFAPITGFNCQPASPCLFRPVQTLTNPCRKRQHWIPIAWFQDRFPATLSSKNSTVFRNPLAERARFLQDQQRVADLGLAMTSACTPLQVAAHRSCQAHPVYKACSAASQGRLLLRCGGDWKLAYHHLNALDRASRYMLPPCPIWHGIVLFFIMSHDDYAETIA